MAVRDLTGGSFDVWMEGTDEPTRVDWDSRSLRAWEAWTGRPWADIVDGARITDIVYVAFDAMRRAGRFTGTWDEFDAVCVEVQDVPKDSGRKRAKRIREGRGDAS